LNTIEISFPLFGQGFVINPPSYIDVFGFSVYLYGLCITAGFLLAGLYIYKRRNLLELSQDDVLDMIILTVPCGIIGARLYYAAFNLSDYVGQGNWLNIFRVRQGGLAVYGGVIGGAIALYIFSRVKKAPVGKFIDAAAFGLLIGQAVGRWGNFFNREAFGEVTKLPWKMGLMGYGGFVYVHPTFLYESLWNAVGLLLMHIYSKKKERRYYGQFFLMYVAWYGLGRYAIEGLRTDSLFIYGTDIRVSQLLAALSFAVAVWLLIRNRSHSEQNLEETYEPALADGPPDDIESAEALGEECNTDSMESTANNDDDDNEPE